MTRFISTDTVLLKQLFSGTFKFRLPWFQRAYAWQTTEVGRLLSDLTRAAEDPVKAPHYLLGTVVVARKSDEASTAIVDGHQRTMTLTLMFAVLRDLEAKAEVKAALHRLIARDGFHFMPQDGCAVLCRDFVQSHNATLKDYDEDTAELSETELNILENRNFLKAEFTKRGIDADKRRKLATYLIENCWVILHLFNDESEAWNSIQIEEQTRHEFSSAALAKASLTSVMPAADRIRVAQLWEQCEARLPGEDIFNLLEHMRGMKLRKISTQPLEAEIAQLYGLNRGGVAFMENEMLPMVAQVQSIRSGEVGTGQTRTEVAGSLQRMSWVDQQVYIPAALHWIAKRGTGGETAAFFRRLERLVWLMRISGYEGQKKQGRIYSILDEIDAGLQVDQMKSLDIERGLIEATLTNLRSENFDRKHYCKAVLRRISIALGSDSGPPCPKDCTLEHILPRGRKMPKPWRGIITGRSVKSLAHQLGNLTFLSEKDNHAADNEAWEVKRGIYSSSSFILSKELHEVQRWDAAAIKERTERLIRILLGAWNIQL